MCVPAPTLSEAPVPSPPRGEEDGTPPPLTRVWADIASRVLQQCGVTLLGIKVVVDCPELQDKEAVVVGGRGGARRGRGLRTRDGSTVSTATAEFFVSSVEACARPLDTGQEGLKLVVRVDQVSFRARGVWGGEGASVLRCVGVACLAFLEIISGIYGCGGPALS